MNLKALLLKTRSYRRFDESYTIYDGELKTLIDLTRYCPSARNAQVLKYITVNTPASCAELFPLTSWAGYLTDWAGPAEGERPNAYILVVQDTRISDNLFCDDGIAIQTIVLGASEMGLGACIIGSFDKLKVAAMFKLPEALKPLYIIALGKPAEQVVIDELKDGNYKYWRDDEGVHHVPKRRLEDIIINSNNPK